MYSYVLFSSEAPEERKLKKIQEGSCAAALPANVAQRLSMFSKSFSITSTEKTNKEDINNFVTPFPIATNSPAVSSSSLILGNPNKNLNSMQMELVSKGSGEIIPVSNAGACDVRPSCSSSPYGDNTVFLDDPVDMYENMSFTECPDVNDAADKVSKSEGKQSLNVQIPTKTAFQTEIESRLYGLGIGLGNTNESKETRGIGGKVEPNSVEHTGVDALATRLEGKSMQSNFDNNIHKILERSDDYRFNGIRSNTQTVETPQIESTHLVNEKPDEGTILHELNTQTKTIANNDHYFQNPNKNFSTEASVANSDSKPIVEQSDYLHSAQLDANYYDIRALLPSDYEIITPNAQQWSRGEDQPERDTKRQIVKTKSTNPTPLVASSNVASSGITSTTATSDRYSLFHENMMSYVPNLEPDVPTSTDWDNKHLQQDDDQTETILGYRTGFEPHQVLDVVPEPPGLMEVTAARFMSEFGVPLPDGAVFDGDDIAYVPHGEVCMPTQVGII